MKTKIITIVCTAFLMAACCGSGTQPASTCSHEGHAHGGGKACCASGKEVKKIISAQVYIKADKVADFLSKSQSLIEKSRAEEGCISYSLYQDPQDKTKFLIFEEWKNQAAIDFHFATEHFMQFRADLEEYASEPAVITIYDSVAETKG